MKLFSLLGSPQSTYAYLVLFAMFSLAFLQSVTSWHLSPKVRHKLLGSHVSRFLRRGSAHSERNPAGDWLYEIDGQDVTSLPRKKVLDKLAICYDLRMRPAHETENSPGFDRQSGLETKPPILPVEPNVTSAPKPVPSDSSLVPTRSVEDEMPKMRRQQPLRELRQVEGVEALQRLKSCHPPSGRKGTFLCKGMCGIWVEKDKHEYIKEGQSVLCAGCTQKSRDSEEKITCGKCQEEFAYSKFLVDLGVRAQPSVCEECQEESQWAIISPCP